MSTIEHWKVGDVWEDGDGVRRECLKIEPGCLARGEYGRCKSCPGRPLWDNWEGLGREDYCPAVWIKAGTWKKVIKDKYERYEVGKVYIDRDGRKVKCTGFEPCRLQESEKSKGCVACPGHPVFDNKRPTSCRSNDIKGMFYKEAKPEQAVDNEVYYVVGREYVDKGGAVYECTGFKNCYQQGEERGGYYACKDCPGYPTWEPYIHSVCKMREGKRRFKEVTKNTAIPNETLSDRIDRAAQQIEKEAEKWLRKIRA